MNVELEINDDHPLALELTSLRAALARFQHEAHSSAMKLQRHSLESTLAIERAQALQRENAAIREELAVFHSHPDVSTHPAALQVPELTLALRRISEKLTLTEETLLTRTNELANALSEVARGKLEVEGAYALAASTRAREEEGRVCQRELMRKTRAAEEARNMTDRVVQEYADLVRNMDRRQSMSPSHNRNSSMSSTGSFADGLKDGKSRLHKLLEEFGAEKEHLEAELDRLHAQMEVSERERDAERKVADQDRIELARVRTELNKIKIEDTTAAKMVSRYMKFSQSTTDSLQSALENMKARHAASISTLDHQLSALQTALSSERRQSERLRNALDELTEQLARESYGRRREISLRLAVVGREDGLVEALRRWVRRAKETLDRTDVHDPVAVRDSFANVVDDATQLLGIVNGDDEVPHADDKPGIGGVARILAAQDAVKTLVEELQVETEKRMRLERVLGWAEVGGDGEVVRLRPSDVSPPTPASVPTEKPSAQPPAPLQALEPRDRRPPPLPIKPPDETETIMPPVIISAVDFYQPSPRPAHETPNSMSMQASPVDSDGVAFPQSSPPPVTEDLPSSPSLESSMQEPLTSSHPPAENSHSPPLVSEPSVPTTPPEAISPSAPSRSSNPPPPSSPPQRTRHPLLAELAEVKSRYDNIQRAFRDCHLALRDLTQTLPTLPVSSSLSLLQTAVSRLDDFNEDARVELEIRVADEERVSRGYEALLSVPGAITSDAEAADVERAMRAFIDGSEQGVARALTKFSRKLEDLQHDVAAVKRAVHELPAATEGPDPDTSTGSGGGSWTSLAAGFFTSSRPASPAPPTFGSLMTSPRLRRAPSTSHMRPPSHTDTAKQKSPSPSPFAALDLRIAMPEHVPGMNALAASPGRTQPRTRTTSGMYMLGLGMRSASSFGVQSSPRRSVSGLGMGTRMSGTPEKAKFTEESAVMDTGDLDVE